MLVFAGLQALFLKKNAGNYSSGEAAILFVYKDTKNVKNSQLMVRKDFKLQVTMLRE